MLILMFKRKQEDKAADSSGLHSAPAAPAGATPVQALQHYLDFYRADYGRARSVVKRRARNVVLATSVLTGGITVVGAVTAALGGAIVGWLGILTAALSAGIGVINAWDALFRHRELWIQRSRILHELDSIQRDLDVRLSMHEGEDAIVGEARSRLDQVLRNDHATWDQLRQKKTEIHPAPGSVSPATPS